MEYGPSSRRMWTLHPLGLLVGCSDHSTTDHEDHFATVVALAPLGLVDEGSSGLRLPLRIVLLVDVLEEILRSSAACERSLVG